MPDELEVASPRRIGRPRREAASAHAAIMDAVYGLLKESSVRELTMEAIAKRAGVGKPTLYKWWPTKASLVFAMFHERLARNPDSQSFPTIEAFMRHRLHRLVDEFHDEFGKVIAELIAEGQSDPGVLQELYEGHIGSRRAHAIEELEKGCARGELKPDTNLDILVDQIFGPIYYRMLLRIEPVDHEFADTHLDQILSGVRG
jgi:AcrR family transcriptional regulator